jgi:hypothetical protein
MISTRAPSKHSAPSTPAPLDSPIQSIHMRLFSLVAKKPSGALAIINPAL